METLLDQQIVNRLAFCRHLLDKAQREVAAPEPYSSEALLTAHDASELFLVLCAEHLGVVLPRSVSFEDYWTEIEKKASVSLPMKAPMKNVNKARVHLKHHFQYPARNDLVRHLARTAQFIEEATPMVFAVNLADVSLVGLVRDPTVRRWLERAEKRRLTSEVDALAACEMAHRAAMYVYRREQWGKQATPFDDYEVSLSLVSDECGGSGDIEAWADEVGGALRDVGNSMETLAVGLDLDRLLQLRRHWPYVIVRDGDLQLHDKGTSRGDDRPAWILAASIRWVTDAALHLQERVRPL